MIIELENTKGIKLKTARTAIKEDISVIPKMQSLNVTANGTFVPGDRYCGIEKVNVNVINESDWRGEYAEGTIYKKGAIVSYNGSIYLCIKDNASQTPTYTTYWQKLNDNIKIEKYDGTVIISDASLYLSGTWAIDTDKLHSLLTSRYDGGLVSQLVNFSAGVKGSDDGVMYYTAMTFNFNQKILLYSGATYENGYNTETGWSEYPDTTNGATINFDGEQNVSTDFYILFTSIATKESD